METQKEETDTHTPHGIQNGGGGQRFRGFEVTEPLVAFYKGVLGFGFVFFVD